MPIATKKTPETIGKFIDSLREGNTRQCASNMAGISDETYLRWQREDMDFMEAIKKAESEAESDRVANIKKAGRDGSWQADAWWLERRRPNDYAKPEKKDPFDKYLESIGKEGFDAIIRSKADGSTP